MTVATSGDCATISVHVAVSLADAFDVFTREIDRWWRQGPKFRIAGRKRGTLHFQPGVGGKLLESYEISTRSRVNEVGQVTAWDPPSCIAFEWRGVNFKEHEKTFVEVEFAPSGDGTLVTVRHRGWSALPDDHPARHDLVGAAFVRMIGMWWGELMTSLRQHVAATRPDDEK